MRLCLFGAVSHSAEGTTTINQSRPAAAGPYFFPRQYFRVILYYYIHATLRNGRFFVLQYMALYCTATLTVLVPLGTSAVSRSHPAEGTTTINQSINQSRPAAIVGLHFFLKAILPG